jgi:hypothetical protein
VRPVLVVTTTTVGAGADDVELEEADNGMPVVLVVVLDWLEVLVWLVYVY